MVTAVGHPGGAGTIGLHGIHVIGKICVGVILQEDHLTATGEDVEEVAVLNFAIGGGFRFLVVGIEDEALFLEFDDGLGELLDFPRDGRELRELDVLGIGIQRVVLTGKADGKLGCSMTDEGAVIPRLELLNFGVETHMCACLMSEAARLRDLKGAVRSHLDSIGADELGDGDFHEQGGVDCPRLEFEGDGG